MVYWSVRSPCENVNELREKGVPSVETLETRAAEAARRLDVVRDAIRCDAGG